MMMHARFVLEKFSLMYPMMKQNHLQRNRRNTKHKSIFLLDEAKFDLWEGYQEGNKTKQEPPFETEKFVNKKMLLLGAFFPFFNPVFVTFDRSDAPLTTRWVKFLLLDQTVVHRYSLFMPFQRVCHYRRDQRSMFSRGRVRGVVSLLLCRRMHCGMLPGLVGCSAR